MIEELGAPVEDEGVALGRRQEGVGGAEVDEVGLDEVDAPVHDDLVRGGRGAADRPDHVGEAVAELERVEVPDGEEKGASGLSDCRRERSDPRNSACACRLARVRRPSEESSSTADERTEVVGDDGEDDGGPVGRRPRGRSGREAAGRSAGACSRSSDRDRSPTSPPARRTGRRRARRRGSRRRCRSRRSLRRGRPGRPDRAHRRRARPRSIREASVPRVARSSTSTTARTSGARRSVRMAREAFFRRASYASGESVGPAPDALASKKRSRFSEPTVRSPADGTGTARAAG